MNTNDRRGWILVLTLGFALLGDGCVGAIGEEEQRPEREHVEASKSALTYGPSGFGSFTVFVPPAAPDPGWSTQTLCRTMYENNGEVVTWAGLVGELSVNYRDNGVHCSQWAIQAGQAHCEGVDAGLPTNHPDGVRVYYTWADARGPARPRELVWKYGSLTYYCNPRSIVAN